MPLPRRFAAFLIAAGAALLAPAAPAAEPLRENLVSFSTSATVEVTRDLLTISLQAVKEGSDAAAVQAQLKQALDAALGEARKAAQPGAMEVRTGNFSLFPRHGKDGRIAGWQGQAELVLEGRDAPRIAQTAGRLQGPQGLNIVNVGASISRELAEQHEAEVTVQAIQSYRARAQQLARQFGFSGYVLREVSVQAGEQGGGPRPMFRRAEMAEGMAAAPLPVEAGKGVLSATVSGSVQLVR